jgi:hypothetical protein
MRMWSGTHVLVGFSGAVGEVETAPLILPCSLAMAIALDHNVR